MHSKKKLTKFKVIKIYPSCGPQKNSLRMFLDFGKKLGGKSWSYHKKKLFQINFSIENKQKEHLPRKRF